MYNANTSTMSRLMHRVYLPLPFNSYVCMYSTHNYKVYLD